MVSNGELLKYNTLIFDEYKASGKYEHFQLGYFGGNKILFLGSNPGQPYDDKTRRDTEPVLQAKTFGEFEIEYCRMLAKTRIGEFVELINGKDWSNVSFANIVKCATTKNLEPDDKLVDEFLPITRKQIELLKPKLVICMGRFAGSFFGLDRFGVFKERNCIHYVMYPHPSYMMRNGTLINDTTKIRNKVNEWMSQDRLRISGMQQTVL